MHNLNSFYSPEIGHVGWQILFFNPFMLAHHHISVARHTTEPTSSQIPILFFQFLLQLVMSASDSAGAIPRNGLQISQVQEHEGRACLQKSGFFFRMYLTYFSLTADLIGLRLMSKACYNPRGALKWVSNTKFLIEYRIIKLQTACSLARLTLNLRSHPTVNSHSLILLLQVVSRLVAQTVGY